MQLCQKLVDAVAAHLAADVEELENHYWKLQRQLVQANGKLRNLARQHKIRPADLAAFPTLYPAFAKTDREREAQSVQRREIEQASPEIGAASEQCTKINEVLSDIQCELVKKLAIEGLDVDAIAKRIALSPPVVAEFVEMASQRSDV
jgi:hypothetical protein